MAVEFELFWEQGGRRADLGHFRVEFRRGQSSYTCRRADGIESSSSSGDTAQIPMELPVRRPWPSAGRLTLHITGLSVPGSQIPEPLSPFDITLPDLPVKP
jgi:hypothetical protein